MKSIQILLVLSCLVGAAMGQTDAASISGVVLDAATNKPVPAALVLAVRTGLPPLAGNTRSGGDGAFQISRLPAGTYSLCVQVQGAPYLDPCEWNARPTTVTLLSGQPATGVSIRLRAGSILNIRVQDTQRIMSQKTRAGRPPELMVGVWGPGGLYYPARDTRGWIPAASQDPVADSHDYQIAVPRDTALRLHVASDDLKLGDALGAALTANQSREVFQHLTGDANPKSFAFTVLGLLP